MVVHAADVMSLGTVDANVKKSHQAGHSDSTVLSDQKKLTSTQTIKTVSKNNILLFGPDAGGMQALSILPNVLISSYNASSVSSRATISMRGVKVGYNSIPGDLETNGITAELDGIPLNSLSQGTGWHSPEVPVGGLMSGTNVIQGPGNPDNRWYDSLGGTINFIPIQPTSSANTSISLSGGSFGTNVISAVHDTGEIDGWSTVIGLAHAGSHSIRNTSDTWPSNTYQFYVKTKKSFAGGSFSAGAYAINNDEFRPNMIPVVPNSEIHVNGLNGTGPLYSQQTSGFYSALPKSVWFKHNYVKDYMAWSHLHLDLSSSLKLSNSLWFRNGNIYHYRVNSGYDAGSTTNVENYHEHSYNLGDKLVFDQAIGDANLVSFGGWLIMSKARSNYLGYAPTLGYNNYNPSAVYFNTTYSTYSAAFLQDTIKLTPALTIVPGISINGFQTDWVNNSRSETLHLYPAGVPTDPNYSYDTNPNVSSNFLKTEPSVGINWKLEKSMSVFANYGIAYQNPTAGNYDNYPINISTLQPVRAATYDLGWRFLGRHVLGFKKMTASIEYFHTKMDHQTIPRNIAGSPVTTFGYGAATMQGVDAQFAGTLDTHWSGFANFGWLKSNWDSYLSTTNNTYYNGYPVSNSPSTTFNAGANYKWYLSTSAITTTLWDQYVGHSYLWDNNNGAPTNQKTPAYNLVNLSISDDTRVFNQIIPGLKYATISLRVLNILDKKYNSTEYISSGGYFGTTSSGYIIANPGAPRSAYLSITAKF
ncbi:hypothetical protein BI364_15425 [Acidihalobacter yilgarnensis]|uniref:TonB-dependent receptor-like beta-barrel domain-containing protein n=2 Tax=Acidihalobacter yilgarnensis TaxID=2819280 RepID=A0A1D8IRK8_9GAMM|nr:hypothetical protein BI364_15425 [Acidihalobacter yilgarnensis]